MDAMYYVYYTYHVLPVLDVRRVLPGSNRGIYIRVA